MRASAEMRDLIPRLRRVEPASPRSAPNIVASPDHCDQAKSPGVRSVSTSVDSSRVRPGVRHRVSCRHVFSDYSLPNVGSGPICLTPSRRTAYRWSLRPTRRTLRSEVSVRLSLQTVKRPLVGLIVLAFAAACSDNVTSVLMG